MSGECVRNTRAAGQRLQRGQRRGNVGMCREKRSPTPPIASGPRTIAWFSSTVIPARRNWSRTAGAPVQWS